MYFGVHHPNNHSILLLLRSAFHVRFPGVLAKAYDHARHLLHFNPTFSEQGVDEIDENVNIFETIKAIKRAY